MNDESGSATDHGLQPVAILGAGTIGASWAVLFAARGRQVRVFDPRPDAAAMIDGTIRRARPDLEALGSSGVEEVQARIDIVDTLEDAVADVDFVQESGPERSDWKMRTLGAALRAAPTDAVIASSSSAIPAGISAAGLPGADRVIVGHPFNPPHVMPLVEVVPGPDTSEDTIQRAMAVYASLGKHPVLIRAEVAGFVANRLQAALVREAFHLVLDGVVTPIQLDEIVRSSLGVRWAATGPFLALHLGGGTSGFTGLVTGIGRSLGAVWDEPAVPPLDDQNVSRLAAAVAADYGGVADEEHERRARDGEIAILEALRKRDSAGR